MERTIIALLLAGTALVGGWIVYIILHNAFISVSQALAIAERTLD